jgi:hypothetical protein
MKKKTKTGARPANKLWWLVAAVATCWSCADEQRERNEYEYYAEYKIWGSEEEPQVTCLLQFRSDREAMPERLLPPSFVMLDGRELSADSSRYAGVFYELRNDAASFQGRHTISYNNKEGSFRESFEYLPFSLTEELPATISRQSFVVKMNKAGKGKFFLSLTDTSFQSNDFYEEVEVQNGVLRLDTQQLNRVVPGPVVMELVREEERRLKKPRGKLTISYSVRREFELKE